MNRLEQVQASQNENSVLREDVRKLIVLLEHFSRFVLFHVAR